jgi:hypothetical protein
MALPPLFKEIGKRGKGNVEEVYVTEQGKKKRKG